MVAPNNDGFETAFDVGQGGLFLYDVVEIAQWVECFHTNVNEVLLTHGKRMLKRCGLELIYLDRIWVITL